MQLLVVYNLCFGRMSPDLHYDSCYSPWLVVEVGVVCTRLGDMRVKTAVVWWLGVDVDTVTEAKNLYF